VPRLLQLFDSVQSGAVVGLDPLTDVPPAIEGIARETQVLVRAGVIASEGSHLNVPEEFARCVLRISQACLMGVLFEFSTCITSPSCRSRNNLGRLELKIS
jgi:hypothetical protein